MNLSSYAVEELEELCSAGGEGDFGNKRGGGAHAGGCGLGLYAGGATRCTVTRVAGGASCDPFETVYGP